MDFNILPNIYLYQLQSIILLIKLKKIPAINKSEQNTSKYIQSLDKTGFTNDKYLHTQVMYSCISVYNTEYITQIN